MSIIDDVAGREILDSRGNPTVEVEVELSAGPGAGPRSRAGQHRRARGGRAPRRRGPLRRQGRAGRRRPRERRDPRGGRRPRRRRSASARRDAVRARRHRAKGRLGANAILGVSLAAAKAVADECGMPLYRYVGGTNAHVLPVPQMNVLNGGAHADSNVDLQEFMILPVGAVQLRRGAAMGRRDVSRAPRVVEGARALDRSRRRGRVRAQPAVERRRVAVARGGDRAAPGYRPGEEVALAIDPAASEFYADGAYQLRGEGRTLSSDEMVGYLADLCDRYPIVSVEDGMAEDDWDGWAGSPRRSAGACRSSATTSS